MKRNVPNRRFWTRAAIVEADGGWSVTLDDQPLHTPGKALLCLPTAALARAVADEWQAQDEKIRPETMPFTRAANSAIEKVAPARAAVVDMLVEYGGSDLLCYRATTPMDLIERQAAQWDPWIDWSARTLGAPLSLVAGVMPLDQPADSLAALRAAVDRHSAFELTGLHDLVTLSGSLVLGLAVSAGALDVAQAWDLSRLDERWQNELWGEDAESAAAAAEKAAAFAQAAKLLALLRDDGPGTG